MDDRLRKFIRKHGHLNKAWQAVNANSRYSTSPYLKDEAKGFAGDEQRRIASIGARIHHGTYNFSASRGVAIVKKGKPGKIRPIVISRVEDRIVQRCVLDALTSDADISRQAFQPLSFGGVPKRAGVEYAGVPAAISGLVELSRTGLSHVMIADIEGFFTRISKSECTSFVRRFTDDEPFLALMEKAISVDLANANALWQYKDQFPYGDIGVAQGNCLSPFFGNLVLSDFDIAMNEGDCRCIRYIDDIIIIAPSGKAASSRFRKAQKLLKILGMNFADDKTSRVPIPISQSFEYLGIDFSHAGLRPAIKSRKSIVIRCKEAAAISLQHMKRSSTLADFDSQFNIPRTLSRISGMGKGWAHHYSFCNDITTIKNVDDQISAIFLGYLAKAHTIAKAKRADLASAMLGYRGLVDVKFKSFIWPPPPSFPATARDTCP